MREQPIGSVESMRGYLSALRRKREKLTTDELRKVLSDIKKLERMIRFAKREASA